MAEVFKANVLMDGTDQKAFVYLAHGQVREIEGEQYVEQAGGHLSRMVDEWHADKMAAFRDAADRVGEIIAALTEQRARLLRGET
jgi:hypothetical protein